MQFTSFPGSLCLLNDNGDPENEVTCNCEEWERNIIPCKHIVTISRTFQFLMKINLVLRTF